MGCNLRVFGCLSVSPSLAPPVQKPSLGLAPKERPIWPFLLILARSVLPRPRAPGDSVRGEMAGSSRVTSPVPAIHRLYIFTPASSLSSSACRSQSAPPVGTPACSSSSPASSSSIRAKLMPLPHSISCRCRGSDTSLKQVSLSPIFPHLFSWNPKP